MTSAEAIYGILTPCPLLFLLYFKLFNSIYENDLVPGQHHLLLEVGLKLLSKQVGYVLIFFLFFNSGFCIKIFTFFDLSVNLLRKFFFKGFFSASFRQETTKDGIKTVTDNITDETGKYKVTFSEKIFLFNFSYFSAFLKILDFNICDIYFSGYNNLQSYYEKSTKACG